ncbi:restriction endonuclease PLD domain-containing protein [Euryhalocaulis caribicus]|uniref:restriction endonuclease PLD domain-containing protein n=1 Tax=Euryhalocaulis caribicus TaxID=1161401 RepID=UPI0003B44B4D|nr:phospholipase D family protein [Euryhalocaulis caribicus]
MLIIQNQLQPGAIQNALFDLMREGLEAVRVCSAYMSVSGSEILLDGIRRSADGGNLDRIEKTIVTSLDFGITDPDALAFWGDVPGTRVFVAGAALLDHGNLVPQVAFHPKLYVFDRPEGAIGSLVGSANLTNRGLTINSEAAWAESAHDRAAEMNIAWDTVTHGAVPLTGEILARYRELRRRMPRERAIEELEPVPAPAIGPQGRYTPFADADVDPQAFTQMWIQSRGMQGGARTQLEMPRGSHRFFGATYEGYDYDRVEHIAEPELFSGRMEWRNRPVTWHGDNRMERINLPSAAMGGFAYENSLILFRRVARNRFELRVYPWDSDSARAYVEASRRAGLVFRVGRNSDRLAGFLP